LTQAQEPVYFAAFTIMRLMGNSTVIVSQKYVPPSPVETASSACGSQRAVGVRWSHFRFYRTAALMMKIDKWFVFNDARVVELVDTKDLKSFSRQRECGFESRPGHHKLLSIL
jgi:hypothetical protein